MSIIVNSMWGFVFALMKCSYAAFGEQNKTDNDSKCQLIYKSHFLRTLTSFLTFKSQKSLYIIKVSFSKTAAKVVLLFYMCKFIFLLFSITCIK